MAHIPDCSDLPISEDADYVYICENNTIYGPLKSLLSSKKSYKILAFFSLYSFIFSSPPIFLSHLNTLPQMKEAGFENLKGHRTVGGMRASIYNAMPIEAGGVLYNESLSACVLYLSMVGVPASTSSVIKSSLMITIVCYG